MTDIDSLSPCADPAPPHIMTAEALADFPNPPAEFVIPYGDDPSQFGELHLPAGDGPFPVIVLMHGGCWQAEYDLAHCRGLAAGFAAAGFACWSLEFRRVGNPGGGWPGTFDDVEAGYAWLARLAGSQPLDLRRVVLSGHSAGGHLALWLARRIEETPRATLPRPRGVLALAPAADLEYLYETGACEGAVGRLLGGSPAEFPERYACGSLADRVVRSTPQVVVVGRYDAPWRPVALRYAGNAKKKGATIEVIDAQESGHFEMIDPRSTTWPLVLDAARRLSDGQV